MSSVEKLLGQNHYYLKKREATQRALEKLHRYIGLHLYNGKHIIREEWDCWTHRLFDREGIVRTGVYSCDDSSNI